MARKCWDCFHLKTVTVTKKNKHYGLIDSERVQRILEIQEEIQVFYCKLNKLSRDVYIRQISKGESTQCDFVKAFKACEMFDEA
jgi:hypothetical protein